MCCIAFRLILPLLLPDLFSCPMIKMPIGTIILTTFKWKDQAGLDESSFLCMERQVEISFVIKVNPDTILVLGRQLKLGSFLFFFYSSICIYL